MNMMQQIVQDMIRDVKDARETIANDTATNNKMNAAAQDSLNAADQSIADQQDKKAAHNSEKQEQTSTMESETGTANTAAQDRADIKHDCDFIINYFQKRKEDRANEKKGLEDAMHILSTGGSR